MIAGVIGIFSLLILVNLPSQLPSQLPSELPSELPSQLPSELPSELPSQLPSQSNDQIPGVPFAGYTAVSWTNGTLLESQQVGYASVIASGDLDKDGEEEIVTAGVYSSGLGDIRVFTIDGDKLVARASIMWSTPSFWKFQALTILDLDGDGNSEIVVGGSVHFGTDEGAGGIQVFRLSGNSLEFVNGTYWGVGQGHVIVYELGPYQPIGDGRIGLFSLSTEMGDTIGNKAYLRFWAWSPGTSNIEITAAQEVPVNARTVLRIPCSSTSDPVKAFLIGGPEFVAVMPANGSLALTQMNSTQGRTWMAGACVDISDNEAIAVFTGFPTTADRQGVTVLIARLRFLASPESGLFNMSVELAEGFVGPSPIPAVVGRPALERSNGRVELVVVDSVMTGERTMSRSFRFIVDQQTLRLEPVYPDYSGADSVISCVHWLPANVGRPALILLAGTFRGDPFVAWKLEVS